MAFKPYFFIFFFQNIFINLSFSFTITFTIEKIRVPAEQCGRKVNLTLVM